LLGVVDAPKGVDKQIIYCLDIFGEETHGLYLVELEVGLVERIGLRIYSLYSAWNSRETTWLSLARLIIGYAAFCPPCRQQTQAYGPWKSCASRWEHVDPFLASFGRELMVLKKASLLIRHALPFRASSRCFSSSIEAKPRFDVLVATSISIVA